jgi:hypothetical protein
MATEGAPKGFRIEHYAVWTGTDMLVWGGHSSNTGAEWYSDGAVYTP